MVVRRAKTKKVVVDVPSNIASPPVLLAWTGLGFVLSLILLAWSFGVIRLGSSSVPGINEQRAVERVARHIHLDSAQSPAIAIVDDPDLLRDKNRLFYKHAEVGDWLLIWSDKAVLYSPRRDRVLSIQPISNPAAPEMNRLPTSD